MVVLMAAGLAAMKVYGTVVWLAAMKAGESVVPWDRKRVPPSVAMLAHSMEL